MFLIVGPLQLAAMNRESDADPNPTEFPHARNPLSHLRVLETPGDACQEL
jgi:hypothetical protein